GHVSRQCRDRKPCVSLFFQPGFACVAWGRGALPCARRRASRGWWRLSSTRGGVTPCAKHGRNSWVTLAKPPVRTVWARTTVGAPPRARAAEAVRGGAREAGARCPRKGMLVTLQELLQL